MTAADRASTETQDEEVLEIASLVHAGAHPASTMERASWTQMVNQHATPVPLVTLDGSVKGVRQVTWEIHLKDNPAQAPAPALAPAASVICGAASVTHVTPAASALVRLM